jgi:glycosyltransferase
MKISVITVVYNNKAYLADCIESVLAQTYSNIEHIIIDGGSTDGTLLVIDRYRSKIAKVLSGPDAGIYDAMNKGIGLATGDVIGLLNADDLYADNGVLDKVAAAFADSSIDACYSDLVYVDRAHKDKIIRYWKACEYNDKLFKYGWMPPHPTLYMRKSVYDRYGLFDLRFKIAADSELMLRFIGRRRIATKYIPCITVKMRVGGTTNKSIVNIIRQNYEISKAARKNDVKLSSFYFLYKLREKLSQYYLRPD